MLVLLSHVFLRHGHADKALVLLRAGRRLVPDDGSVLRMLAYAELVAGDPGAALATAEHFIRATGETGPGAPIQLIRARALRDLARVAEARDCFRRFIQARAEGT
jgi:type III secretion protein Y